MVNAERLRVDEASTGGVPCDLGPWQFHLLAVQ